MHSTHEQEKEGQRLQHGQDKGLKTGVYEKI